LFLSTVINYVDRQTLSALAPYLKEDFKWTNEDYALIVISFRMAYALGQLTLGRFIDRVGTRIALTATVTWYSAVAVLTSLAAFFHSPKAVLRCFIGFRFLLGLGEAPNWPGAIKAVSEWFPKQERGWAAAFFDSGSSIGAAVAPMLVVGLYLGLGRRWWPAFVLVGILGFIWLILWRLFYYPPEEHPRIDEAELNMIMTDRLESETEAATSNLAPARWLDLMRLPQTWGVIAARVGTDPVWWFIADWFMLFLVQEKHFDPKNTLVAIWIPFIAYDIGNLVAGGLSSWLISRDWPIKKARKLLVAFGALGMSALIPAIYATNLFAIAGCFAIATFSYACFCLMALVLPSDLYDSKHVATVSGTSGAAAGLVTVVATYFIGSVTTHYSFKPVLIAGSVIPLVAAIFVFYLIRNPRTQIEQRYLRRI
jgi:ACS family hexuronate transporter-like MFS transporter